MTDVLAAANVVRCPVGPPVTMGVCCCVDDDDDDDEVMLNVLRCQLTY